MILWKPDEINTNRKLDIKIVLKFEFCYSNKKKIYAYFFLGDFNKTFFFFQTWHFNKLNITKSFLWIAIEK